MQNRLSAYVFALWVAFTAPLAAADFNVFAAASLSDAMREIATIYAAASGDKPVLNLAGSNALARQIAEGAPADVFFSADEARMDELAKAGLIVEETRRTLLSNTLVVVVNAERGARVATPADLAGPTVRRLALAETRTVPAGIYAREYLENIGLWEGVKGKVVGTANVRATLAAVEAGNADAGIVYKTDALISKRVRIAFEVAVEDGPVIAYPVAVVKDARQSEAARRFVAWLGTEEALAVFEKYGFLRAP